MPVYQIDGLTPVVDSSSYVHPTAVLIGDVIIGRNVYIGPNASLRGDFGRIVVQDGANVQDNCVMHGFPKMDTIVEQNGHIGHGAILHGCHIRRNALIGMNTVVMDGAEVGENTIVGAASFIKAHAVFEANKLVIGSPARVVRSLSEQEIEWKSVGTREYQQLVLRCHATLKEVEPLREMEEGRAKLVFNDVVKTKQEFSK
ncbi:phenylacetic acid degradation protein PaaY [Budviciaceae bacterium CWB-B4]|uniref:Phenylacetic acid degradation protein PaaY n=1 Tax=Limnobaculum xujianqingii TaxID=2738837 RepID=A0A9D7AKW7_9GAMM|nr:phenylacetic acid degradation protein PaaY [Limnobaculum xujianqingii]MBK5074640.1 phenylacetic acid degradation protein PaaY [Limnobaculum xujianqingii]MBK5178028.1 phenylacetic acid degradation protein PaaY [Limnobaculum xujianqingii]